MKTPTVEADQDFPHTAPTLSEQATIAVEAASNTLHLVDPADGSHTLCGLPLAQVLTGGYCEHLNGSIDDPQFERAIFARDGSAAESCEFCLSRHPAVLTTSIVERP